MKNRAKIILSLTLLLVVLFVASFPVFSTHEHSCEHTECLICGFIRNLNDGVFVLLILIFAYVLVLPFVFSRLAYIITQYKGRAMTPIMLGDILLD